MESFFYRKTQALKAVIEDLGSNLERRRFVYDVIPAFFQKGSCWRKPFAAVEDLGNPLRGLNFSGGECQGFLEIVNQVPGISVQFPHYIG